MTITVIKDFITKEEEEDLLQALRNRDESEWPWIQLKRRRALALGGSPTDAAAFGRTPLPAWLTASNASLMQKLRATLSFAFNHILVNEYDPGDGILPHEDGPAYCPSVAILSTQSAIPITFQEKAARTAGAAGATETHFLPARSLLLFDGVHYTDYLHCIAFEKYDEEFDNIRDQRISFTIRQVLIKE